MSLKLGSKYTIYSIIYYISCFPEFRCSCFFFYRRTSQITIWLRLYTKQRRIKKRGQFSFLPYFSISHFVVQMLIFLLRDFCFMCWVTWGQICVAVSKYNVLGEQHMVEYLCNLCGSDMSLRGCHWSGPLLDRRNSVRIVSNRFIIFQCYWNTYFLPISNAQCNCLCHWCIYVVIFCSVVNCL